MVSPTPKATKDSQEVKPVEAIIKKERKKKGYRGETVADRLLASAKRMEEMRIAESLKKLDEERKKTGKPEENSPDKKNSKSEKYCKLAHEIDDLSALEWETSSEQSGL